MRRGAKIHLTQEQIEEASRLADAGWTPTRIGEKLGFHRQTVQRAIDSDWQEMRNWQVREARQRRYKPGRRIPKTDRENATSISVKEDAAARLAEIPPDTRSLTARLAGDPLPGRSALDKRQQA